MIKVERKIVNGHKIMAVGKNNFYEEYISEYKFTDINEFGTLYYTLCLTYNGRKYMYKLCQMSLGYSSSDSHNINDKVEFDCLKKKDDTDRLIDSWRQ